MKRGVALGDSAEQPDPATALQRRAATNAQPQSAASATSDTDALAAAADDNNAVSEIASPAKTQAADVGDLRNASQSLSASASQPAAPGQSNFGNVLKSAHAPDASASPTPAAPTEQQFAADNHPHIFAGIHGQLLPSGGTMHLKLDPPELGALQVTVHMQDGVMSASFQTSNDDATRLLSHSLTQLKHVLEQQGVSVEKLHVTQTSRDSQSSFDDQRGGQQNSQEQHAAQQEQQRREMLRRMWRRLTNGSDPLDLVA